MATATEAAAARGPLASPIADGVNTLSQQQAITFTKYVKMVLPLDGFVFWVKADLLSPSAIPNTAVLNSVTPNQPQSVVTSANTLTVQGSLHYATEQQQDETASYSVNRIVFTALSEIQDLNAVSPTVTYIGEFQGQRFAFSTRASFYAQTQTYHYRGDAIYPLMESQIIDSVDGFAGASLVVSNSLPIWLGLNQFCPMYPSFLVPDNIVPPFASVMIKPEWTRTLQALPYISRNLSHHQLCADRVSITFYGLRNDAIMDWLDYTLASIGYDGQPMGLMSVSPPRDEKRIQAELSVIAMKKTIEFEVSYHQTRLREVARQLILSCIPTFYFES